MGHRHFILDIFLKPHSNILISWGWGGGKITEITETNIDIFKVYKIREFSLRQEVYRDISKDVHDIKISQVSQMLSW